MGRNGRNFVLKNFNRDTIASSFFAKLKELHSDFPQ
jgi:hypothetical protein